ncbi:hypothetical protein [Streptomyces sp. NPDC052701]|uniref:hypothetical protein n=1 Tax=Streptomyces sp. NPDC052701 TaxID=3155533 RepID=UPI00343A7CB4
MNQVKERPSDLPQPLRAVASGLRHVPGAGQVGKMADNALDRIGAVSPRGRRMAVYAGAGLLGVAGVVEWPVAVTGAAVAWLTQPRPGQRTPTGSPDDATWPATARSGGPAGTGAGTAQDAPGAAEPSWYGAGDKLASSRRRHDEPEPHVHEQPARVGDTRTASALKQVAEATSHHDTPPGRPGPEQAHGHGHDGRPADDDRHSS